MPCFFTIFFFIGCFIGCFIGPGPARGGTPPPPPHTCVQARVGMDIHLRHCVVDRSAWSVWTGAAQTAASVTSLHLEKALADSVAQVAGLRAESDALRAELRSSKRRVVGLQRQLLKPFVFGDTAGAGPPPPPQGATGGPEAAPPVTTRQWVQPAAVPQLDARAS